MGSTVMMIVVAALGVAAQAGHVDVNVINRSLEQQQQQRQEQEAELAQDLQQLKQANEQVAQASQEVLQQHKQRSEEIQKQVEALISQTDIPRVITKKSVQDEEAIKAAEGYEFEYLPESRDYNLGTIVEIEPVASATHDHHDDHHHKVGYSAGGPLVNIAQGAAAQAHNFERSQPAAAAQAAYVAKNRLGQSAGLSAATAAAAFAGKRIILRGLEQQAYNAHRGLESEKLQLQSAQRAATAAANAAQQARHQVQVVTTALNAAQATAEHASAAAAAAAGELAAQTAMVGAAKARLQAIENQLHHARVDFEAAQAANLKAAHAAQVAQNNAAAAAAHAAEVANVHHDHGHGGGHDHGHGGGHDHGHGGGHDHGHGGGHDHGHGGGHGHGHGHHHLEHHASQLQEDDGNHDESVAIPVSSSTSSSSVSSTERDADKSVRLLSSSEHQGSLSTVPSTSKEESYDAYDSFPY